MAREGTVFSFARFTELVTVRGLLGLRHYLKWVALLVDPEKALSYQRSLATFTRIVGEADSEQRLLLPE